MSSHLTLLHRLIQAEIDFVIVGGYAAIIHGCNYVTQDIDICCLFNSTNLLSLQTVLVDLHPVHRMTPKRQPLQLTRENVDQFKNLYLDTDLGRLDCLSAIDGLGDFITTGFITGFVARSSEKLLVKARGEKGSEAC